MPSLANNHNDVFICWSIICCIIIIHISNSYQPNIWIVAVESTNVEFVITNSIDIPKDSQQLSTKYTTNHDY